MARYRSLGLLVCLALALGACGKGGGAAPAAKGGPRIPKVGLLAAPTRALVYSVDAIGTLEAYQVVSVPSRLEGVVESLGFEEGEAVTPETVVAVVDGVRRDLLLTQAERAVKRAEADVEQAKAAVARAAAQEAAARAGADEAQGMLSRREAARAKAPGLVADEELESVRAQLVKAKAQVAEAEAAVGEADAHVRASATAVQEAQGREAVARRDAADARVKPPIAGVVQARHVVVGQWVRAGDSIATLVDARRLRLRFKAPEAESVALVPGKVEIVFRTSALPGRELPADLVYVQGSADPVTRMVECLAEVRAPDPHLKPGFFASVTVRVRRADAAVVVPEEAVLATERGLVVFELRDGKAKETRVALGLRTKDGWVEIVEGLAPGTPIAVENVSTVTDGAAAETFPSARGGAVVAPGGAAPPPPAPVEAAPARSGGPR